MSFLIFLLFVLETIIGAQIFNCPRDNVKFEKIIGLRPPNVGLLLYQSPDRRPITRECISKCGAIAECRGFVLDYANLTCHWYREETNASEEDKNVIGNDYAWFPKTCLNAKNCSRLWVFERVPGATLVGAGVKQIPFVVTRDVCQQNCLDEKEFLCRSSTYTIGHLNGSQVVGKCVLSDTDRGSMANSFRVSRSDEEYFENQCLEKDEEHSFEEYDNITLSHVDERYENKTKDECQRICLEFNDFICRGFSIQSDGVCLIHSEDSKIHGPKMLMERQNTKYYEKAPYLNVSVTCSENNMLIRFQPKYNFEGKIYMINYSENKMCYALGHGTDLLMLNIPLKLGTCGIDLAKNTMNSTLMYSTLIVQYNPLVQTQADRILRIGCIQGNSTKVLVGTGVNVTAESNPGVSVVNATLNTPRVLMKIVDLLTQKNVSETQIGQDLQLIIEAESSDAKFDIWAGHLVAMTDNGQDSILLLDDRGCPTNLNIFPVLTKVVGQGTKKLVANFQAFKFSTSPNVKFSVMVQFCDGECPRVDCGNYINTRQNKEIVINNYSDKRTKRDIDGTKVENIPRHFYQMVGKDMQEVPLEFIITVQNSGNPAFDKFIYGKDATLLIAETENKIICTNAYVLISFFIIWILITILMVICAFCIVKRYKKHLEIRHIQQMMLNNYELNKNFDLGYSNLDNRKVHFANETED